MSTPFKSFKLTDKIKESSVITSFYFKSEDEAPLSPAKPGQYITLKIPKKRKPDSKDETTLRTYSLSHDSSRTDCYRITVKRETAPLNVPNAPDGVGSCWLHDQLSIGDRIEIASPRGSFFLDESRARPVVLLSGGVGQTPMLSMLHSLVKTNRNAVYLHACENGDVHAMQAEVSELVKAGQGRIDSHIVYREPTEEDRTQGLFDDEGFIDKALLKSLLPIEACHVYLCGPDPFMRAMYLLLIDLGIPKSSIFYEFFGKGTPLEALVPNEEAPKISPLAGTKGPKSIANLTFITNPDAWSIEKGLEHGKDTDNLQAGGEVYFSRSDVTVIWTSEHKSLLELAESNGLAPEYSCRTGICNSCKYSLLEGEVAYFESPLELPDKNALLLCSSRPVGDIVIDL